MGHHSREIKARAGWWRADTSLGRQAFDFFDPTGIRAFWTPYKIRSTPSTRRCWNGSGASLIRRPLISTRSIESSTVSNNRRWDKTTDNFADHRVQLPPGVKHTVRVGQSAVRARAGRARTISTLKRAQRYHGSGSRVSISCGSDGQDGSVDLGLGEAQVAFGVADLLMPQGPLRANEVKPQLVVHLIGKGLAHAMGPEFPG